MTNDNWQILEAAFANATRLEGDEQATFLAVFASEHPELEQQLLDLLAADAVDDEQLVQPIATSARELSDAAVDPWKNRRIDAWTIKHRIADGGMGAVFLAERSDDQYRQNVALKIMTAQLLAKDAVTRFRSERQILASLSHPNIAKLIDGGSTEEQLPYLVMEYIDGLPIDRYCDENKLSVSERLGLFLKVCAAVDFAHRNLIVHRDLKPNNILVDKHGEPKLLDFGIAKLLESNSSMQTVAVTRAGSLLMTPEYASPEQVRGEPISVVTDVYALGVLLYRMLTGQSPYGSQISSKHDMERAIIESVPKRPSTVVTGHTDDIDTQNSIDIGIDFAKVPDRLRRTLSGDLDNIVLKSLQKDPERRYHSVRAQIEDIRNYLAQRPVTARPDTIGYRTAKFVARHLSAVIATSTVLLAAVATTTYYTTQLAAERDIAQQEREAAEQVTDFLVDIFAATEAGKPDAETVTIREVLDRGADKIDESLADQPLIHARLLQHIARTYSSIARYDDALEKYRDALTIFRRETGESADTAHAQYRFANAFLPLKDWQTTHDNYLVALDMHRAQAQPDQEQIAQILRLMVYTSQRLGNNDEAESYLNEMIPLIESIYGPEDPQYANGLYSRATMLRTLGRYEEAIEHARNALRIIIDYYGEDAASTVNYRHVVGLIEWDRGHYLEALEQYERGIAVRAAILGPDHPSLFNIMFSYGATLAKLERYEEAAASHQRLIELQREVRGPDNFDVAYTSGAYGMVLLKLDRVDEAEAAFVNADRIWELNYGPGYLESGVATIGLGHVAWARGDEATARAYYQSGIAVRESGRGKDHPATARAVASLADLEFEVGDLELAKKLYQRALAIHEDPAHPNEELALVVRERIQLIDSESQK